MTDFNSLATALEEYFNTPYADLPEDERQRVENDFFPMPWDKLSPNHRRSVAAQLDYQRDPDTEGERQYWSDFFNRRDNLQRKLMQWESVATPTATDLATKESKVSGLQQELDRMDQTLRQARGDFYPEPIIESTTQVQPTEPPPSPVSPTEHETANDQITEPPTTDEAPFKPDGPQDHCAVFRNMENLRPDELAIAFVGDISEQGMAGNSMLEITARKVTRRLALAEFNLVDRRSGVLNQQAGVLIGLAQGLKVTRSNEKLAATMKRLRDVFRVHLGINTDPFTAHEPQMGWLPRFKIADLRGKAAERARQLAELRTASFENMQDSGHQFASAETDEDGRGEDEDEADRYIREHDRDNLA